MEFQINSILSLSYFYYVTIGVSFIIALSAIMSTSKAWYRILITLLFTLSIPIYYQGYQELVGFPKDIKLEWYRDTTSIRILAARMVENEGIYLYTLVPKTREPMSYKLPWSKNTAQKLQDAMEEAKKNKNGLYMKEKYEKSTDTRERMFYAPPQPKFMPKPKPKNPQILDHPSWGI